MEQEAEGVSPVFLVAVFLLVLVAAAAFVVPSLMPTRVASNETAAVAGLNAYLGAQTTFRREDRYGIGKKVYANTRDGAGFPDLYEIGGPGSGGEVIKLIDITFAQATVGGARAKAGYCFADITGDADGPYDPATEFGLCAVPATYSRSGRNMFIVNAAGVVYQRKATPGPAGRPMPVTVWPDATELSTWMPVGGP